MAQRWLGAIAVLVLVVGAAACTEDGDERAEDLVAQTTAPATPPDWSVKTACPNSASIGDGSTCKLISGKVKMSSCESVPHPTTYMKRELGL